MKRIYKTTNDATAANQLDITATGYCAGQTGYGGITNAADATARCQELINKFHEQIDIRADDVKVLFHMPPTHL